MINDEDRYVARNWWGIILVICHSQHRIAKCIACDISCTVVQLWLEIYLHTGYHTMSHEYGMESCIGSIIEHCLEEKADGILKFCSIMVEQYI